MTRRTLFIRIAIGAAVVIIGGLAAGWFIVERVVSRADLKARIEIASSQFLQRPLTIEELQWHPWPKWSLVGRNVRLWADPSKQKLLLELPSLEAHLSLLSFRRMTVGIVEMVRGRRTLMSLNPVFSGKIKNPDYAVDFKVAFKEAPQFTAAIELKNVRYHTLLFPHIDAVVKSEAGVYTLEPTEFEGLGGSIAVQGSFHPSASTDSLKVSWTTTAIQLQDLFRLAGSTAEVSGLLDSVGHIESGIGARFLPSMNGEIKVDLKDGWFGHSTGLLKVLSRLNLSTLITEATGKHRSRVPFDQTHGVVKIVNGVAFTVEPFVLENKTIQMAFMGRYDLPNRLIDGKIAVNVLMITDEIISKIPIVRNILLRGKKGLTPIWLSVKGPVADPEIKVLSGKSIASPVWNTISNIFHLPGDMIDKMKGK